MVKTPKAAPDLKPLNPIMVKTPKAAPDMKPFSSRPAINLPFKTVAESKLAANGPLMSYTIKHYQDHFKLIH